MKLPWRKGLLLCVLLTTLALSLGGTFCWSSVSQSARNEAWNTPKAPVELDKLERAPDGSPTTTPLPGACFLLFRGDGTQVGGAYTTDALGQILLALPAGDYWFEEWAPAPWHGFDLDAAGAPITKYPFTVTREDVERGEPVVVTVYDPRLTGDLTVTKEVENPDGSPLTAAQLAQEFTFTVTFSDGGTYSYTLFDVDGTDLGSTSLPSGGTLKLRHGQRAVFAGLPAGVQYIVTETPEEGYGIRSRGHTGHITPEGATAAFRNLYRKGSLVVTKVIVNEDGSEPTAEQLAQDFPFTVTFSDGGTYPYTLFDRDGTDLGSTSLPSGGTVTLKHGQRAVFAGLPDGVTYTVTETPVPAGYRPLHTAFSGTSAGGFTVRADFENRWGEEPDEPGGLVVEKALENPGGTELTEEQKALEFEFTVTFADGGAYPYTVTDAAGGLLASGTLPSGGTVKLRHGWRLAFPDLPRGLGYTVTETGTNGCRALLQSADGTVRGGVTAELLFRNVPPEPETGTLTLTKRVEGGGEGDKEFVFTVTFSDTASHSYTIYDAAGAIQGSGAVTGSGDLALRHGWRAVFPDLPKGVTYVITERDYSADGYTLTMSDGTGTVTGGDLTAEAVNAWHLALIKGVKTWDLGGHTDVPLPSFIWVRLYQGTTLIDRVPVRPDAAGNWTYSFHVPKYDANGNEIVYRVEEEPVAHFSPEYPPESWDIINHYIPPAEPTPPPHRPDPTPAPTPTRTPTPSPAETPPPSEEPVPTPSETPTPAPEPSPTPSPTLEHVPTPSPPPGPDVPKTDDGRRPGLWLALCVVSVLGIANCVWYASSRSYHGKRVKR